MLDPKRKGVVWGMMTPKEREAVFVGLGVAALGAFTLAPLIVRGGDRDESCKPEVKP
jgi:hypothetical protein